MRSHDKRSFWQRIRRPFRWCRIALWSLLLLLLSSFLYLNVIGVPDFLKARLVAELRSRGIDLQFSRLRWRWFQGLVAESVQVGGTKRAESPVLSVAEVAVKLDPPQLRKFRFRVASLGLRHGRLTVPLSSADEPTPPLIVNDIMTELRLLPNDRWELEHFHASCLGARLNVTGTLTNASAIRQWRAKTSTQPTPGRWRQHFIRTLKLGEQIHFSQPPQITLALRGDARNPAGVRADLS